MSTILNIEAYQASNLIALGIPDEPYSQYNYIDLIEECKTKDVELVSLRKMVNGAKYEQMRRDMERKALANDPNRRRHAQELKVGPVALFDELGPPRIVISGFKPPSTIGLKISNMSLPLSWQSRDVFVVKYTIATQQYLVSTSTATFVLHGASEALMGEKGVGLEIRLKASCSLIFRTHTTVPLVTLKYINHQIHYAQDENISLHNVIGQVSVLMYRHTPTTTTTTTTTTSTTTSSSTLQFFMVQDKRTDFIDWKYVLRSYLIEVTTFPQFAPNNERQRIRTLINDMRDHLTNPTRWSLDVWDYNKLMIVYEGQGWSLNNAPFTKLDGDMLMNLSQEATKAMELMSDMARKEIEQRVTGKDTTRMQALRHRWTLPTNEMDHVVRPYEIEVSSDGNHKEIDINMESVEHACQRTMKEYIALANEETDGGVGSVKHNTSNNRIVETMSHNNRTNISQTSKIYLVPMKYTDTTTTTTKYTETADNNNNKTNNTATTTTTTTDNVMLRGNAMYSQGKWTNASFVMKKLNTTNFQEMLNITSKNEWKKIHHACVKRGGGGGGGGESGSNTVALLDSPSTQQHRPRTFIELPTPRTPTAHTKHRNRKMHAKDWYGETPITKLRPPTGGWLYSESQRRIGPGTNDPKLPETANQRKKIQKNKLKRKSERKKALKKIRREQRRLARSKSMNDGAFLPKL